MHPAALEGVQSFKLSYSECCQTALEINVPFKFSTRVVHIVHCSLILFKIDTLEYVYGRWSPSVHKGVKSTLLRRLPWLCAATLSLPSSRIRACDLCAIYVADRPPFT